MPECPACFGELRHDHRDEDAWWGEHYTDVELAELREAGMIHPVGIVDCDECEATGVVSEERLAELSERARVAVAAALERVDAMSEAELDAIGEIPAYNRGPYDGERV